LSRTRIHNFMVSLDGYSAGSDVTPEAPIGGAERLFGWFDGRVIHGVDRVDDPITMDRSLISTWGQGVGAEIMGRRKFGYQSGPWTDDQWRGWWGEEPPFHTPVFVLTHHERSPIEFANGTSFHFINASPQDALREARAAAGGLDVRLGGGPDTIRQFLEAGLVDFMHLVFVPIVLGGGASLWTGLGGIQDGFTIETATSASGLTHQFWNKAR
jgi:dihydrofolate reductase